MRSRAFDTLLRQLETMTARQRGLLCVKLSRLISGEHAAGVIDRAMAPRLACPSCAKTDLYRHGKVDAMQRYRCRHCGRTFNALTGTPLAHLRMKSRWLTFLDCMLDPGATVRRTAAKIGVHKNTSFRWRHRFLHLAKHDRPRTLQGIAEADETFLLESQKGARQLDRPPRQRGGKAAKRGISGEQVCIVVARDRAAQTVDFVAGRGALSKAHLRARLLPVIDRDILLVTDANAAYRAFAHDYGIAHQAVNVSQKRRVDGAVHIQNVNAYHSRFKTWLRHFNGVATSYLANYLGWRWAIDTGRIDHPDDFLKIAAGAFHT
jgi:transposase-like protein